MLPATSSAAEARAAETPTSRVAQCPWHSDSRSKRILDTPGIAAASRPAHTGRPGTLATLRTCGVGHLASLVVPRWRVPRIRLHGVVLWSSEYVRPSVGLGPLWNSLSSFGSPSRSELEGGGPSAHHSMMPSSPARQPDARADGGAQHRLTSMLQFKPTARAVELLCNPVKPDVGTVTATMVTARVGAPRYDFCISLGAGEVAYAFSAFLHPEGDLRSHW